MERTSGDDDNAIHRITRRELLKRLACGGLALTGAGSVLSGCAPPPIEAGELGGELVRARAPSYHLPTDDGQWVPPVAQKGDLPSGTGAMEIESMGQFRFEAGQLTTVRPDIFQPGHFSLFDILVHLSEKGDIALEYHLDEAMNTHAIDELEGKPDWWYNAYYSAGWFESNVFRLDMYPYKNDTRIRLGRVREGRLEPIYASFREELDRLHANGGQVVIPDVRIRAPRGSRAFQDVPVIAHDVRTDVLQPGVVTGLDALISLARQDELPQLKLTWYERIARAEPVDSYWVEQIGEDTAVGGCGFIYETGPSSFAGFSGTHIHVPADVRVTVSPEYALWFWICLGPGGV